MQGLFLYSITGGANWSCMYTGNNGEPLGDDLPVGMAYEAAVYDYSLIVRTRQEPAGQHI